ncbi:hypothetical protein [Modestobacter sp. SSW1-42]|uniref:hypothetical protein n=1 Tax=Modestobacter sp. SSW1-42 TaxID=596372 RepID=UPI003987AA58
MTQLRDPGSTATRTNRLGCVLAVLVNAAGLVVLHVWPGWEELPFLTDEAWDVLPFVDAALVAGIVVNVVLLARRPGWPIAAGTLVTTVFGLVASVEVLSVFPFDVSPTWATLLRVVLVFGIVGAVLGILALLVSLLRLRQVEGR